MTVQVEVDPLLTGDGQATVPLSPDVAVIVKVWMLALQLAVVPALVPVHVQPHGPVPVTAVGVPVAQKLVVGATLNVPTLLLPQTPLTGAGGIRLKVAEIA